MQRKDCDVTGGLNENNIEIVLVIAAGKITFQAKDKPSIQ